MMAAKTKDCVHCKRSATSGFRWATDVGWMCRDTKACNTRFVRRVGQGKPAGALIDIRIGSRPHNHPPGDSAALSPREARLAKLLEDTRKLPLMTKDERETQSLGFTYGSLAASSNHKPERETFWAIAQGMGWSRAKFAAWAIGKRWWVRGES